MRLGSLYHWSPRENRVAILREGLRVMQGPETSVSAPFPWLSFSPRPSRAWGLSGGMREWDDLTENVWDLWECRVPEGAAVHVMPHWGPEISEVRVMSSIPADHVWWVAERMLFAHDAVPPVAR